MHHAGKHPSLLRVARSFEVFTQLEQNSSELDAALTQLDGSEGSTSDLSEQQLGASDELPRLAVYHPHSMSDFAPLSEPAPPPRTFLEAATRAVADSVGKPRARTSEPAYSSAIRSAPKVRSAVLLPSAE